MSFMPKTELGKLKTEHLSCEVERRRLERHLSLQNDELDDLKRELGFSKDAEAKAIMRYKRALNYYIDMEAEVAELKTRFEQEKGQLLGILSDLKDKLREREVELGIWKEKVRDLSWNSKAASERHVSVVKCSSKSRKSDSDDVSSDASNHSDDSFTDASDHEQDAELTNIQIFVKFLTGKTIAMSAEPYLTIGNLKSKIQDKEDMAGREFSLIFEGRYLEDSSALVDYNIQQESFIHHIPKLRG